jgi:serine/threonine protein kinase
MPPELPDKLPPGYRVRQHLGSGQTSHVYLAEHALRGRVALKLPRPELVRQPILRRMFENEVQITLNLKHPNIVAGLEGYPTGEGAFLALEYCAGRTLDQLLLERGRLPLEHAYRLILDVARGLEYCHYRNVLHRDVKPANVFLTEEGRAKLGDFGTGLFMSDQASERVGTAFYMAPEIFQGAPASPQSDIYSLGVLAYEVIAGTRPFGGETFDALMMAHLSGLPKPLKHYRSDVKGEAVRVIGLAMARDPKKRYHSVKAFVEAFASVADEDVILARPNETPTAAVGRSSRAGAKRVTEARPGLLARLFGKRKRN